MGYYPQESLYKPYKYHGYTVRGTPNCPLRDSFQSDGIYRLLATEIDSMEMGKYTFPKGHAKFLSDGIYFYVSLSLYLFPRMIFMDF